MEQTLVSLEGIASTSPERQQQLSYYLDDWNDRTLREVARLDYRRRYRRLLETAEEMISWSIANNFRLYQFNALARGLYLLEGLVGERRLRSVDDYRVASDLLVLTFVAAGELTSAEIGLRPGDDPRFAEFGRNFVRRLYAVTPQIPTRAERVSVLRRIVELLIWDFSRDSTSAGHAQTIAEARRALERGASLAEIEALSIIPFPSSLHSFGASPFGDDSFAPLRAQVWQIYQRNLVAAASCQAFVVCGTTDGQGRFFAARGGDGAVQEELIHKCMDHRSTLPANGRACRDAMVCSQYSTPEGGYDETSLLLSVVRTGRPLCPGSSFILHNVDHGRDPRGIERLPWWLRPL